MFFWFTVSLIGFTVFITLLTRSFVFPVLTALFLYCMLNMREKLYGEDNQ